MIDTPEYWRFVIALVFVLALIFAVAWVVRRFGLGGARATPMGRQRRLAIQEVLVLDARRRLVLIRRDDTEHLVLLGANGETVLENPPSSRSRGFAADLADVTDRGAT